MAELIAACVQMRSSRDVSENLEAAEAYIREAAAEGAAYVQTPEMTNLLVRSREELFDKIVPETEDVFVQAFTSLAKELNIHLHAGSLAIRVGADKAVNRGYLFGPQGAVLGRYDKIHMFDVDLPNGESWRESATYAPGDRAVLLDLPIAALGVGICYDVRFPSLFRELALAGAHIMTAPAAFTRQTGKAHWHVLQRARAIENGAFVISAAQGGLHDDGRETFGHSVIIDPWGRICAERANDEPGIVSATIDLNLVEKARKSIPNLANIRPFGLDRLEGARNEEVSA